MSEKGLPHNAAYFTCCMEHGPLYYFAPSNRAKPPYLKQVEVKAILDIAQDGTLAGVELVWGPVHGNLMDPLPPPPAWTATEQGNVTPAEDAP